MKNKLNKLALLSASIFATSGAFITSLTSCGSNNGDGKAHVKSIEIEKRPTKREYNVGDNLDLQGLVVNKVMSDGSWQKLTPSDYRTFPTNGSKLNTEGDKTVQIVLASDDKISTNFNISVVGTPTPEPETIGKVEYELVNGGYKVTGLTNASTKIKTITVPATYNGKRVIEIEKGALKGCSNLKNITLPFIGKSSDASGAEGLFGWAFGSEMYEGASSPTYQEWEDDTNSSHYCEYVIPSNLETVSITNAKQIPAGSFSNCKYIETININNSNSIETIKNKAFYNCSNLDNFDLSFSSVLTTIEKSAFEQCYTIDYIEIPNTVTTIGDNAFSKCINSSAAYIPASVETMGNSAFSYCSGVIFTEKSEEEIKASGWDKSWTDTDASIIFDFNSSSSYKYVNDWLVIICGKENNRYCYLAQWMGNWQQANLTIPGELTIDGEVLPVKMIGSQCFIDNIYVKQLTISEGVEVICPSCFKGCIALEQVNFPTTLVEIRDGAFSGCTSLYGSYSEGLPTSILEFSNVKTIGKQAFYHCESLKDIQMNVVETIADEAFAYCYHLCPDNTTDSTRALSIPKTCISLGEGSFKYCFKYAPDGCTSSTYYPTIRFEKDGNASHLTEIPESCFEKCGVRVLTSPEGDDKGTVYPKYIRVSVDLGGAHLTKIGDAAFKNFYMQKLTGARATHIKYIGDYAFYYARMTSSEPGEFDKQDLQMDQEIEYIGDFAFAYCSTVQSLTFNTAIDDDDDPTLKTEMHYNSLKHLGQYAFYACNHLNFNTLDLSPCVYLENWTKGDEEGTYDVANTPRYAFAQCTNLQVVKLPGTSTDPLTPACTTFTRLPERIFEGCTSLGKDADRTPMVVPKNITDIRAACFNGCNYLQKCYIDGVISYYGSSIFYNNYNLEKVTKSDGTSVTFSKNLENSKIGSSIYYKCEKLTNPPLPAGSLPEESLDPKWVTYYDLRGSMYYDNKSLTSITIPANVYTIGSNCFFGCENLSSVTFGEYNYMNVSYKNRVTYIYANAFSGCTNLQSIDLSKTNAAHIYDKVFENCSSLKTITLPNRSIKFYSKPFDTLTGTTIKFGKKSVTGYDGSQAWDNPETFTLINNPTLEFERKGTAGNYYYTVKTGDIGGTNLKFVCYSTNDEQ